MNGRHAIPLLVLGVLTACQGDPRSARGVAERFVDQHYVRIDLEAVKEVCTGLALRKIEEEQRLTAGQVIDGSTRMPTVRYRLISEREADSETTYVFAATIRVAGDEALSRRWIVNLRRTNGDWKVANFSESFD